MSASSQTDEFVKELLITLEKVLRHALIILKKYIGFFQKISCDTLSPPHMAVFFSLNPTSHPFGNFIHSYIPRSLALETSFPFGISSIKLLWFQWIFHRNHTFLF